MSTTQYLLGVNHGDEISWPEGVTAGRWVFGGGLMPASSATVIDATGPEPVITDGPYVESKEYLGGFWVIEADDLDEAMRWGTEASAACHGPVEVRPFQSE
jgi:hypothetical protein